ncbi:MAG: coproporphyrinogen dehydrogenase HemZ [Clostridiales bacterium]|nr:coproporphyrinogen dehydrogenase HemZ [Clostridiales bacterium]
MIVLYVDEKGLANEAGELIRSFYPTEKVIIKDSKDKTEEDFLFYLSCTHNFTPQKWCVTLSYPQKGGEITRYSDVIEEYDDKILYRRALKGKMKSTVYSVLKENSGASLPYGMLTGVRPLTIAQRVVEASNNPVYDLQKEYDVSRERAKLLVETCIEQQKYPLKENAVSFYVHIPFCTTKCSYCSFPSDTVARAKKYLDKYVSAIKKELEAIDAGYKGEVESLYIGGGTPTSLSEEQFAELMEAVGKIVIKRNIPEFTVESGRPDTISYSKLKAMKNAGVTRICINPQTLSDKTLSLIGRAHTSQDFFNCFYMARELGFHNINTDIILGLQSETQADMLNTLEGLIALSPEGITVHSLAKKHASIINQLSVNIYESSDIDFVSLSADIYGRLFESGYIPYYLYRQKYTLGNAENVGFIKPGHACIYNIRMMDDRCSVLAAGAGAVSKMYYGDNMLLERQCNYKYAPDYIEKIDIQIENKLKMLKK